MPDASGPDDEGARWDALDAELEALRRVPDTSALVEAMCGAGLRACDATAIAVGRVRDGVWSPWRGAALEDGAPPVAPRAATALEGLELEREVTRTRDAASRPAPGRAGEVLVVAAIGVGGVVLGLVHARVAAPGTDDEAVARVSAFADALGSLFELLAVRDRSQALDRVVDRLAEDLLAGRSDHAVELADAGRSGGGPAARAPEPVAAADRSALTDRQREVLDLVLRGLSNAQIAERLVIGVPTVKSHVRTVLRSVGAVNRAEAIARFVKAAGEREDDQA